MISISCCMIVKNEEKVLSRCLDCIKNIVDEIIIVDTGSTDTTQQIAKKYTDKIYEIQWEDDFSKARNYAFDKAEKEYLLWLDADDIITLENQQKLLQLKQTCPLDTDLIMMKYQMGKDESMIYYRERLMKKSQNYRWENPVHEVITPRGNIMYSDITITHQKDEIKDTQRNLKIYEKKLAQGYVLNARERFYYARELYFNQHYKQAIENFEIFINDQQGWIENKIEACLNLYYCYLLLNQPKLAFQALMNSFLYAPPRAEIICELAHYLMENQEYDTAIYWYEQALLKTPNLQSGGFIQKDCYTYLPAIQLCVCYSELKQWDKAIWYNELAGKYKPDDEIYRQNKTYFLTHSF